MNSIIEAQIELEFCKPWFIKEVEKARLRFKEQEAEAILEGELTERTGLTLRPLRKKITDHYNKIYERRF